MRRLLPQKAGWPQLCGLPVGLQTEMAMDNHVA
jgi:hypothetical protein